MVAVHGYNFGEHHGTTIRLAHGRAVVIAAWRPTTRITILLPYGNQPLEGSKWRRTMRCGPTWLMTLVGHHTVGHHTVWWGTIRQDVGWQPYTPRANVCNHASTTGMVINFGEHHTVLQWHVTMWHIHVCQQPHRCPHDGGSPYCGTGRWSTM